MSWLPGWEMRTSPRHSEVNDQIHQPPNNKSSLFVSNFYQLLSRIARSCLAVTQHDALCLGILTGRNLSRVADGEQCDWHLLSAAWRGKEERSALSGPFTRSIVHVLSGLSVGFWKSTFEITAFNFTYHRRYEPIVINVGSPAKQTSSHRFDVKPPWNRRGHDIICFSFLFCRSTSQTSSESSG